MTLTQVPPPGDVAADILALPNAPFPPLVSITEGPVLRPDGTILFASGYDPATRLFHVPARGLRLPPLLDTPAADDARRAVQFLKEEMVVDFPFASDADRANYFACLLTPILRPAIEGHTPICLIDKPTPGSGAGLLTDLVSIAATGTTAPKTTAHAGKYAEAEWKKSLTAALLSGQSIVTFDNLEGVFDSPSLCAMITTRFWNERLLGSMDYLALEVRCSWIATGNNVSLGGDMPRRCYRVFIDPKMERPQERQGFRHPNLIQWATDHRGEILSAILTIIRAWFVAGKPQPKITKSFGSFEDWQAKIAGILAHAGVNGFLDNQQDVYALANEDNPQWEGFLNTWFNQWDNQPITVRTLANALQSAIVGDPLLAAIPDTLNWDDKNLEKSRQAIGLSLKKRALRVFGSYRLERSAGNTHAKVSSWRVVRLA